MGFFKPATDKASVFKRNLKLAVRDGDTEALAHVLKDMGDLPKSLLKGALEEAVVNEQIQCATMLLEAGADPNNLSTGLVRYIVRQQKKDLFRLLVLHGAKFSRYSPGTSHPEHVTEYDYALLALYKDIEREKLKEEIAELKEELTGAQNQLQEAGISPIKSTKSNKNNNFRL